MTDYGFVHAGKVYTPNGTPAIAPEENETRNQVIQAAELARVATKPDAMLAYYSFPAEHAKQGQPGRPYRERFSPQLADAHVSLWLGVRIGRITAARVYRHNFGGRMVSLTVDVDGTRYHGRASYDWGQCVRLRKGKR